MVGVGVALGDAAEGAAQFALVAGGEGKPDEAGMVDGVVDFGTGLEALHDGLRVDGKPVIIARAPYLSTG